MKYGGTYGGENGRQQRESQSVDVAGTVPSQPAHSPPVPPLPWALAMRRAEKEYWISVCRFIVSRGARWSYGRAALIADVSADTVQRRLSLALDGTGSQAGAWLAKAVQNGGTWE